MAEYTTKLAEDEVLRLENLSIQFGGLKAVDDLSFAIKEKEIFGLIGPNGAGKTTTLHTITGLLAPKSGSVLFEGKDITKVPAHKIVSMGMSHVPEGRRVFAELSVYEHLKMGAYTRKDKKEIEESHRHRYEVNNDYREVLEENGMSLCGLSPDSRIVEMVEIPSHPWFIATQAHPELKSRPNRPHPLFKGFVEAALENQKEKNK